MVSCWWLTLYSLAGMTCQCSQGERNVSMLSSEVFFFFSISCWEGPHRLDTITSWAGHCRNKTKQKQFDWHSDFWKHAFWKGWFPKGRLKKSPGSFWAHQIKDLDGSPLAPLVMTLVNEWSSFWFLASKTTTLANCHGSSHYTKLQNVNCNEHT